MIVASGNRAESVSQAAIRAKTILATQLQFRNCAQIAMDIETINLRIDFAANADGHSQNKHGKNSKEGCVFVSIKKYCKQCGHELESWSIGWHCSNCGCFEDMNGNIHDHKKEPFMLPKTNADKIRSMTDEELANFFLYDDSDFCPLCEYNGTTCDGYGCREAMIKWLKQPAEGE